MRRNMPDCSVRFAKNKYHKSCAIKYIVYMEDLNEGNMSLTNGIEYVIKDIIKCLKHKYDADELWNKTFFFYKDSEGEYVQFKIEGQRGQFFYLTEERAQSIIALMNGEDEEVNL